MKKNDETVKIYLVVVFVDVELKLNPLYYNDIIFQR